VRVVSHKLQHTTAGALPTFFEQVTAIALLAFRSAEVQLAILETGLGGRLDATTAAHAEIAAITPIAYDHQEYLGHTLAEIAAEKAAIIRKDVTAVAVVAPQPDEAHEVILSRCRECDIAPRFPTSEMRVLGADEAGRLRVTFTTAQDVYENIQLSLPGRHQATNAATALALAEVLRERGLPLTSAAIIEGLETTRHAGRLELLPGTPSLLFDGAHNAAGALALRAYLDEFISTPVTMIFGAMKDKDLREIAATLFPAARRLILTLPTNPRAASLDSLRQLVAPQFIDNLHVLAATPAKALRMAAQITPPGGLICVTGSLYLVGEVKSLLMQRDDNLNRHV
jgi:dihydrofolate synthase/folylpolyglutamate synthase